MADCIANDKSICFGQEFSDYLAEVRRAAIEKGISSSTVDSAFQDLVPDERVIGFDRRQPEFVQTFEEYLDARVSDFREREGRRLFRKHASLLADIEQTYQVDAAFVVSFWGLETSFGRYQGNYSIIRSLATLGHDPRRSAFFTTELVQALRILDEQHIDPEQFVGAWAAMGQAQFIQVVSSRLLSTGMAMAENIWHSRADVFASIANYLRQAGWRLGGVRLTIESLVIGLLCRRLSLIRCRALRDHTRKFSLDFGIRLVSTFLSSILARTML